MFDSIPFLGGLFSAALGALGFAMISVFLFIMYLVVYLFCMFLWHEILEPMQRIVIALYLKARRLLAAWGRTEGRKDNFKI